jgi:hypothetical protein
MERQAGNVQQKQGYEDLALHSKLLHSEHTDLFVNDEGVFYYEYTPSDDDLEQDQRYWRLRNSQCALRRRACKIVVALGGALGVSLLINVGVLAGLPFHQVTAEYALLSAAVKKANGPSTPKVNSPLAMRVRSRRRKSLLEGLDVSVGHPTGGMHGASLLSKPLPHVLGGEGGSTLTPHHQPTTSVRPSGSGSAAPNGTSQGQERGHGLLELPQVLPTKVNLVGAPTE